MRILLSSDDEVNQRDINFKRKFTDNTPGLETHLGAKANELNTFSRSQHKEPRARTPRKSNNGSFPEPIKARARKNGHFAKNIEYQKLTSNFVARKNHKIQLYNTISCRIIYASTLQIPENIVGF